MTEQNLHDYNKWLMEVWNPNQLYIPFAIDAPKAFLDYQAKQLIIADVVVPKGTLPNNCKVCGRTIEEMGKMTSMCGVSACPNY
jgi:hypothetical protein